MRTKIEPSMCRSSMVRIHGPLVPTLVTQNWGADIKRGIFKAVFLRGQTWGPGVSYEVYTQRGTRHSALWSEVGEYCVYYRNPGHLRSDFNRVYHIIFLPQNIMTKTTQYSHRIWSDQDKTAVCVIIWALTRRMSSMTHFPGRDPPCGKHSN